MYAFFVLYVVCDRFRLHLPGKHTCIHTGFTTKFCCDGVDWSHACTPPNVYTRVKRAHDSITQQRVQKPASSSSPGSCMYMHAFVNRLNWKVRSTIIFTVSPCFRTHEAIAANAHTHRRTHHKCAHTPQNANTHIISQMHIITCKYSIYALPHAAFAKCAKSEGGHRAEERLP